MIRWSMRPVNEQGKFTIATDLKDGKVRVVVTALTEDDEFLNFLDMSGSATSPDPTKPAKRDFDSPRRRQVATSASSMRMKPAVIFLAVSPGKGYGGPLLAGVSVPYSSEFRERETNMALLEMLAKLKPQGGEAGQVINTDIATAKPDELTIVDTFRATLATAISSQDAWPLAALLAACLFLITIAIRRVSIDPALVRAGGSIRAAVVAAWRGASAGRRATRSFAKLETANVERTRRTPRGHALRARA